MKKEVIFVFFTSEKEVEEIKERIKNTYNSVPMFISYKQIRKRFSVNEIEWVIGNYNEHTNCLRI